jgi:hypothetical protein
MTVVYKTISSSWIRLEPDQNAPTSGAHTTSFSCSVVLDGITAK